MQGAGVQPLVGELRSPMLHSGAKSIYLFIYLYIERERDLVMWLSDPSKLPLRLGTPVPHSPEPANLLPTAPLPLSFLSPPGQCHCIFQGSAQVLPLLKNLLHGHISSLYPHSVRCSKSISGPYHRVLRLCISHFSTRICPHWAGMFSSAGMITLMAML